MTLAMPAVRPSVPHFSSGPCAKRPGWSPQALKDGLLGRSHRSKPGRAKLKRALDLTREILQIPADYRIAVVPASDTGAIEMALWSLLGPRPVTMLAWESFGEGWVTDVVKELKLKDVTVLKAAYGDLPDLARADPATDIVFTWNGTTSGVRVANADWIAADRRGSDDLRRDLGCVRPAARLGQARCDHLLLAEGGRRRGGATACSSSPRARSRGCRPIRRHGRCPRSSA